jgi:polyisoprenoid-binding protein YceI
MMLSKVRGTFNAVTGTVGLADGSNIPVSVNATIDASSIDTAEPQRDGHLKSPDFLHVEQHPHLTFVSTSVSAKGGDAFEVTGDLTIHGVTKSVVLAGTVEGRTTDPWGNDRIAFSAATKINRKDFGMTFNQTLETGGMLVGEDVAIELEVQAIPAK